MSRSVGASWIDTRSVPCARVCIHYLSNCQIRRFALVVLAIVLASALGCGATATKEGTGEYVDDSVITTKVKAVIFNDSELKVNEINVETFKGMVQLSGFVRSQENIDKAVQVRPRGRGREVRQE